MDIKKILQDPKFASPVCQSCIKEHMGKYNEFVDEAGTKYDDFAIPCEGIPTEYISDRIRALISEDQLEEVESILNPVSWAEKWIKLPNGLPWVARWYQKVMLQCTARRRVSRCGRRTGKCLEKHTLIMTPSGPEEIQNLEIGDVVYAYHTETNSITETSIMQIHDQGMQEVVDLTRRSKAIVSCTKEHRWHVSQKDKPDGIRRTHQLHDHIGITRRFVEVPLGSANEPHAYAIGALLGDGCSRERGHNICISSENSTIPTKVSEILELYCYKNKGNNFTWTLSLSERGKSGGDTTQLEKPHCNYYKEWCNNRYAHEKTVDLDVIKTWNRRSCLAFLAGLLDTDGGVCQVKEKSGNISLKLDFAMQAKSVIEAVKYLLFALFQCDATIHEDKREKYKNGSVWCISIKNNLFVRRILKELSSYIQVARKQYLSKYDLLKNSSNEKASQVGVKVDYSNTRMAHCYDISVDTPDNLYLTAQGFVTHNTDAISVDILHYCFTNKNKRVLVVAPYKSQTEEIISRIRGFISTNPRLANSVARDVSSPYYEIRFHNGSRIRGFSSGTKSGSDGAAIRGQDADRIYLDEADYLTEGDLKTLIAILNTHDSVELWASSTPTGRRAHFWRWCVKTPSYKEFYYPSEVLPHWDSVKDQIRADYMGNQDGWVHEIMAEFGEQTVGVFQHQYVGDALLDYNYNDQRRQPGWIYSIGVDWNSDFGTEICVVGFNGGAHFKVIETLNVPRQGWTQLAGIEAVIAMHRKWHPKFIYVDEGAGATNIELLRKYGYDITSVSPGDMAAELRDIVHGYNFSSKIDVRDPMTKAPIKKHAKPFLVENAVRFFEEHRLTISSYDNVLRNQLGNYIIKHRTVSGIPVYGLVEERIGDHRLDALMLALVAFKLEMSDFGKPQYSTHVGISVGFARSGMANGEVSKEKEAARRAASAPESRFEDQQPLLSTTQLPSIMGGTSGAVPNYRYGWDTDEEGKYALMYKRQNAQKRARFARRSPSRSNF